MPADEKQCPYCAETIKAAASVCRFCNRDLVTGLHPQQTAVKSPVAVASLQEVTYLQSASATVTNTRAIISGKTYAMANITSVAMHKESPNYGAVGCIGLIIVIVCFIASPPVGILAIILIVVAMCFLKPSYHVRIGSASAESNILVSSDENYIRQIVEAMNKAIVNRG